MSDALLTNVRTLDKCVANPVSNTFSQHQIYLDWYHVDLNTSSAELAIFTFLGNAPPIEFDHENDVLNLVVIVRL